MTDSKGVITEANSVFVEMVRRPREQLIGAPHNINRHPLMPGGAFALMWATIEAGKPFCAYVHNLASDGSRYTVFATITPLAEGYLSVRTACCDEGLLGAATSLYEAVRPLELEAQAEGATPHDAAMMGLNRLAELLAGAGFPNYDEFTYAALPSEVTKLQERGLRVLERPDAVGPVATLLATSSRVDVELRTVFDRMDALHDVADALVSASRRMRETIASGEGAAAQFAEAAAQGGFAPILLSIKVWRDMNGIIAEQMVDLVGRLARLRESCAATRFRIALAWLHNAAVAQFACELLDGADGSEQARPAIGALARALSEGVADMQGQMETNNELAVTTARDIDEVADLIGVPTGLLVGWRENASKRDDPLASSLLPDVSAVVERGQADAESLRDLSRQCQHVATPLDVGRISAEIDTIRLLAAIG
jgi:hypothetical protein